MDNPYCSELFFVFSGCKANDSCQTLCEHHRSCRRRLCDQVDDCTPCTCQLPTVVTDRCTKRCQGMAITYNSSNFRLIGCNKCSQSGALSGPNKIDCPAGKLCLILFHLVIDSHL